MTKKQKLKSLYQQAKSFSAQGKHKDAIGPLAELTRRRPEKAVFWCLLGNAHRDSGDPIAAIHAYETAIQKGQDHQLSQLSLAQAYMEADELARAEGWLIIALNSPKGHNMAYSLLGILRGKQGRWKESEEYCQKAIDADPSFEEAHLNLGIALLRQGSTLEAKRAINRALEIHPGYEEAVQALQTIGNLKDEGV